LYLEPDVEWVNDGLRVHGEDEVRVKNNQHLKALLKSHNIEYKILNGDYLERLNGAIKLVDELLT
jgi:HTH-type transcriptional repressor of NAD biosynthesis genes